jgi:hypothetical protein
MHAIPNGFLNCKGRVKTECDRNSEVSRMHTKSMTFHKIFTYTKVSLKIRFQNKIIILIRNLGCYMLLKCYDATIFENIKRILVKGKSRPSLRCLVAVSNGGIPIPPGSRTVSDLSYCLNWLTADSLDWLKKLNSMVGVRERTISTERPPLVGEVIANLCG